MGTLIVIVTAVVALAVSFGLAFGVLDLLFNSLAAMRPAFAQHSRPVRTR